MRRYEEPSGPLIKEVIDKRTKYCRLLKCIWNGATSYQVKRLWEFHLPLVLERMSALVL